MKYIRVIDDLGNEYLTTYKEHCEMVAELQDSGFDFEGGILKQADTVEELFDEYVVYAEDYGYFNPTEIIHRRWVFDHIEEAKEQIKLIGAGIKRIIYGAIWTTGECESPILKSVAKMKGILPNGEIDWELL